MRKEGRKEGSEECHILVVIPNNNISDKNVVPGIKNILIYQVKLFFFL